MRTANQRLTAEEVGTIVNMLRLTTDREFDCSECLQHVGEFAEIQLAKRPASDVIAKVEQHLALCPECRQEYEALVSILRICR
jgi:hypothetical protein